MKNNAPIHEFYCDYIWAKVFHPFNVQHKPKTYNMVQNLITIKARMYNEEGQIQLILGQSDWHLDQY